MTHLVLDGLKNGFICFITETEKCLLSNGNKLYINMELMKAAIIKAGLKHREYKILLSFMHKDKRVTISYNEVLKLSNGTYVFYYNDEKYIVTESTEEIIIGAGYMIINDGDKNRIDDFKEGIKVYRDLTNRVYGICKNLVRYPELHLLINKHSWKRFCIGFTDSTVKITFLDRDIMVKMNQARMTEGKKVFPYYKNMDKYSTLYALVTCEAREGKESVLGTAIDFLDYIANNYNVIYPGFKCRFQNIIVKNELEL